MQNYFYDLHDQLIKAEIFKQDGTKETWHYVYDALGRRIAKAQTAVSDRHTEDNACLKDNRTEFLWDGSHLLQEQRSDGLYTYIYTDLDSYEPLAQIHNWTNEEGESQQQTNYFHCDQIGIPREMTDGDGKLLWFGDYYGWGKLKTETNITNAHQPFRLQNQYCDAETGLHYNFFRYYEPDAGRFVNQDPIGLLGGDNLYQFIPNAQMWLDPLGLLGIPHFNGRRGEARALLDITRNGFKNIRTQVPMVVNGKNIVADVVAERGGKTYVFESKFGSGRLTKNQRASRAFPTGRCANANTSRKGGGTILTSKGKVVKVNGRDITFILLRYKR